MNVSKWTSGVAAILIAAFFYFWWRSLPAGSGQAQPAPDEHIPSFVRSMEGSNGDGDARQNEDGDLIVSAELRLLFDYYLTATGEKSLAQIRAEIDKVLDQKLKPKAAAQARHLLGRYLSYKQALADAEKNPPSPVTARQNQLSAIRNRWTIMQQLRLRYFSTAENQAMFRFDDAYDMDALARIEISQDTALSDEQKQEKLKALDAAMSPELREARNAPYQVVRLEEQAAQMRANGASEDDVYRMRAAVVSPEAANRLAQVDRETQQWTLRIQQYLSARQSLMAQNWPSDAARQTALQQLRDQFFTAQEQRRLPAYE